ncbi:MAG: hypothetical protein HYR63_10135 [Proteobacteria bacterium]|nr:hypothetical protein [Pseudomonadota bacterium]
MHRRLFLALLGVALIAAPSFAQSPPAQRIRGRVESLNGTTLMVKSREGQSLMITLTPDFAVSAVVPITLDKIVAGSYVGAASMPQADGTQKAIEVLVFPESSRGSGEGHYPWDLQPQSMMTNATVAEVAAKPQGRELTLTYKGGTVKVVVPPEAPIVTFEAGDRSLIVPGAGVLIGATKAADGSFTAARINVGKNGFMPPM